MTSFDGYDDEQFEPDVPVRDVGRRGQMGIEDCIRLATQLVQESKGMPLSSSALVNREELLDLLGDAHESLPAELRDARWVLRDRDQLLDDAQRQVERMLDAARGEAARLVDKAEIVRQARMTAEQIIADADERARTRINEAEDFIDTKLGGMEIVLDRLMKTVTTGRERLRPVAPVTPPPASSSDFFSVTPHASNSYDAPVEDSFFDQDAD